MRKKGRPGPVGTPGPVGSRGASGCIGERPGDKESKIKALEKVIRDKDIQIADLKNQIAAMNTMKNERQDYDVELKGMVL